MNASRLCLPLPCPRARCHAWSRSCCTSPTAGESNGWWPVEGCVGGGKNNKRIECTTFECGGAEGGTTQRTTCKHTHPPTHPPTHHTRTYHGCRGGKEGRGACGPKGWGAGVGEGRKGAKRQVHHKLHGRRFCCGVVARQHLCPRGAGKHTYPGPRAVESSLRVEGGRGSGGARALQEPSTHFPAPSHQPIGGRGEGGGGGNSGSPTFATSRPMPGRDSTPPLLFLGHALGGCVLWKSRSVHSPSPRPLDPHIHTQAPRVASPEAGERDQFPKRPFPPSSPSLVVARPPATPTSITHPTPRESYSAHSTATRENGPVAPASPPRRPGSGGKDRPCGGHCRGRGGPGHAQGVPGPQGLCRQCRWPDGGLFAPAHCASCGFVHV